jgi:hypothetical protein
VFAGLKRAELEIAEANPFDFLDRMARLKKSIAQRVASRFRERHLVPRRFLAANPRDPYAGRAHELLDLLEGEKRFQFYKVGLPKAMRLEHAIGKLSVIRQKNQSRRMVFKPPDWKHTRRNAVKKILQRATAFRVAHG